jgi:hypothetical protein
MLIDFFETGKGLTCLTCQATKHAQQIVKL